MTYYTITSEATSIYNCIAWAAGDNERWWDPHESRYWPPGVPREISTDALMKVYKSIGYKICKNSEFVEGFSKIAIYTLDNKPTHAARQLDERLWTSKLGKWNDVAHELNQLVEDPELKKLYGKATVFMEREEES